MLSPTQRTVKRMFDAGLALIGLMVTWPIIALAWLVASIETRSNGIFSQTRIGLESKPFRVYKIKTMRPVEGIETSVTTQDDRRITRSGAFFRRTKIDELPQLFNVLLGQMSFVGPRPDVPGYADRLEGEDRIILQVRPGITGPASLKFKNEEEILARQEDPETYNSEVIWPEKIRINKEYIANWSLKNDIIYIMNTIAG
jgi:lipopolysaccharide/colanic/teichoic acid biosynthesis glycosyltransferase